MEKIVIGTARGKMWLLTFVSLAFVVAGVLILTGANSKSQHRERVSPEVAGWLAITFFGACASIGIWQLVDSRPRLIIDDEGVYDRTLSAGKIPWADIRSVRLQSINSQSFICLELSDEDRYLKNASPTRRALIAANRALGFAALNLNLSNLNADIFEVFELVERKVMEASAPHDSKPAVD